jgi:hypothetical protein
VHILYRVCLIITKEVTYKNQYNMIKNFSSFAEICNFLNASAQAIFSLLLLEGAYRFSIINDVILTSVKLDYTKLSKARLD